MLKTSLVVATTLSLSAIVAVASDKPPAVTDRCAAVDLRAIALIEDHGAAKKRAGARFLRRSSGRSTGPCCVSQGV